MPRWREMGSVVAPSVVAAFAGATVSGLLDGFLNSGDPEIALVAAGYVAAVGGPLALALGLLVRGVLRAWHFDRVDPVPAPASADGASHLAGWLLCVLASLWALAGLSFFAVVQLMRFSRSPAVVAVGTAIAVTGSGLLLLAIAPLLAGRFGAAFRRLHRAGLTLTARRAWIGAAVAATGSGLGGWRLAQAQLAEPVDVPALRYALLFFALAIAVHWAWPAVERHRRWPLATTLAALMLAGTVIAIGLHARFRRPATLLQVWMQTQLAGEVVDELFDVHTMRTQFRIPELAPARLPGELPRNLVLITIDTVRADRTSLYGGPAAMPNLARIAQTGAVFERAFSPGNVTRRSLPTIALGLSPHRIRGRVQGWGFKLDPRHVLFAERLRAAGYDTVGFFCCRQQFAPEHRLGLRFGIAEQVIEREAATLSDLASEWIAARSVAGNKTPWFLWLHYIEPHGWERLAPKRAQRRTNHARYDHILGQLDEGMRAILDALRSGPFRDNTIVVISSDHGEGLGDHGFKNHGSSLYNAQTRVPLIIVGPGIPARRIERPVGLVDLAPTMLELAGFVPPGMPAMDGVSLARLLRGQIPDNLDDGEAYSVMMKDRSSSREMSAIVAGRYKLITEPGRPDQLFDIVADPDEKSDLASAQPERVDQLRARLAARRATDELAPF